MEWVQEVDVSICAICSNLPRESGISLTNGAGPGTGRKRHTGTASFRWNTPVGLPLETFQNDNPAELSRIVL